MILFPKFISNNKARLFFWLSFLFLAGCHHPQKNIYPGFYYWKTNFELTAAEKEKMEQLGMQKLYLRFFDITPDASGRPVPVAKIYLNSIPSAHIEVIPVVFITNKIFEHLSDSSIDTLAGNIFSLVDKTATSKKISYNELQVDCDWTLITRARYFTLLDHVRERSAKLKVRLSCTIRLHQVKYYRKTGVPPVDRGMLMFYNMGNIEDTSSNSIFNVIDASKYTASIKNYTLPLDVALPIFCWVKHYRDDHLIGLLNNTTAYTLDSSDLFVGGRVNHYRAVRDGFFHGEYFRRDDLLVAEEITPTLAKNAAVLLAKNFSTNNFTVALYHWDESNLTRYANQDIEDIYHYFK